MAGQHRCPLTSLTGRGLLSIRRRVTEAAASLRFSEKAENAQRLGTGSFERLQERQGDVSQAMEVGLVGTAS